jgi:hypothetical protein
MNIELKDLHIPDQNVERGLYAIERLSKQYEMYLLTETKLLGLAPPDECYIDLAKANDPTDPHNKPHIARILSYGTPFAEIRHHSLQPLPWSWDVIIGSYQYHDCRLSNWSNYPNHGAHAADWLRSHGGIDHYHPWKDLEFILKRHSDNYSSTAIDVPRYLLEELKTVQDVDAADIWRYGTNVFSASQIQLRTQEAINFDLVYISQALQWGLLMSPPSNEDLFVQQVKVAVAFGLVKHE